MYTAKTEQKVFLLCLFLFGLESSGYEPTVLYLAANGEHAPCTTRFFHGDSCLPQRNQRACSSPSCSVSGYF